MKYSNSIRPLYLQIQDDIKNSINSGKFSHGEKIPTETQLQKMFNVSRVTVRKAINGLVDNGVLIRQQGIGTFVNYKKVNRKIEYVRGFTDSCIENGLTPKTILLDKEIITPTPEIKRQLKLADGEQAIWIRRKRLANEKPIMLENNYFSQKRFAFLLNENLENSLYHLLGKKYNIFPDNPGKTTLELCVSDIKLAKIMEINIGVPFFYMETEISDQNKILIHVGHQYYLGEYYKFDI
ncbi:MAG: GntR family transcriptional regulator [Liquorilactobacillus hordei]|jgi:GntR family transcriptional regulator|uniref:HTH gntR-type domain-containing protein n=1 Tax=Liquorilactobacillus satsumensis DSM 16230 = JCM 12392 TaxID=1423801 RepID=A0A0R1VBP0_9LACO|nr:GntR family transcriptional regulator [Liquorilactobacillus satsumensis]KRM00470.1 hypothetical protein FD50_GL000900 [Liquorilactobacillus satsumensis DSM 16230 = JCM 12392]MCC7667910.1 GntR family transcriptional regulator [Liquorilactobacillus satsumensis]MCP9313956.1 GntR family transcriptional regulator [Liquorilactobacillus satsumensis]MCP9329844.1 GntR family transcriptional regulator [Liquorilactobacillus satsumensis]MCP9358769.1 GntR family transcriptional regulator [Liquorilactoba